MSNPGSKTKPNQVILVTGLPACGKSHYGKWLETEKDYFFMDFEHDIHEPLKGSKHRWSKRFCACLKGADIAQFVKDIGAEYNNVVVDWGFPPDFIHKIMAFQTAGIDTWWFDGDHSSARKAFLERNRPGDSIANFEKQMCEIKMISPEIKKVFCDRVIITLDPMGRRLSPTVIFERMFQVSR